MTMMTLFMNRCVFGRHVEKERVVAFLLQPGSTAGLSALAVVGAANMGKTTLVKHALDDERMRGHFSRVEWFRTLDVVLAGSQPGQTEWGSSGPEFLTGVRRILNEPRFRAHRSLLVFEITHPIDETPWAALRLASYVDRARRGEQAPLHEEYWYFFNSIAFGGENPRDHPRLAALAREISRHLENAFFHARVLGMLLRTNFNVRFWRRVLDAVINCQHHPIRDWTLLHTSTIGSPHKHSDLLTLQDVLNPSATSSSGSGLGGGDTEKVFSIRYFTETLYKDTCSLRRLRLASLTGEGAACQGSKQTGPGAASFARTSTEISMNPHTTTPRNFLSPFVHRVNPEYNAFCPLSSSALAWVRIAETDYLTSRSRRSRQWRSQKRSYGVLISE
ncbi:hypothetical protein PR202_gb14268 [Eleusine coracana subsp. coracana]|uniref:Uncharacterized protein n=1 Tax=Eleusine coracana subsp. coracana TaxID=191504 RepID=A0AAV5EU78_ELECO|nr:hypothetical protein PR202_gb14268 [Eleusine coracana subsp. coracana]